MSSINGIVNSALSALNTFTSAIDVINTNIGNVSTAGYSRQQAVIQANAPISTANGEIGSGVGVTNVERIYSSFLTTQLNSATQDMGKWTAQQQNLDAVEQVFNDSSDSGLSSTLTTFFNNWQSLVNNPSGSTERSVLVNSAANLAKAFNSMSSQLTSIQQGIDSSVVGNVAQVNQIVQQIAALNKNIQQAQAAGQNTNTYKDELDSQVTKLSNLININTYSNANGQISIQLTSGKPLVDGTSTWLLSAQANVDGLHDVTWSDGSTATIVNGDITGGELGGELNVRDTMITSYQTQLNTLANSIITNVNNLQEAGYDINGDQGEQFFTGNSAANIAVNTDILNDPGLVAAASTTAGAPGDGSNASAIANLQNSLTLNGGTTTFSNYYSALTSQVGSDAQATDASYSSQSATVQACQNQVDSYSGVSVDEEETNLILYQNAYAAAAKVMTVLDEMMQDLLNVVSAST